MPADGRWNLTRRLKCSIFMILRMNVLQLWFINFSTSSLRTSENTNLAVVGAIEAADVRIFV